MKIKQSNIVLKAPPTIIPSAMKTLVNGKIAVSGMPHVGNTKRQVIIADIAQKIFSNLEKDRENPCKER